jgi:hypothetical protein
LERARAFDRGQVTQDATRRITLDVKGKGCVTMRARVAAGWVPGPPFATHGDVGVNARCTPTAMREWLAAVPGDLLEDSSAQGARGVTGGSDVAPQSAVAAEPRRGGGGKKDVAVEALSVAQRIAELTPASDTPLAEPTWIRRFASEAAAGEDFWA